VEDQGEERPDMRLTYSCELHLGAMVSSVPPTKPGGPWIVRCIAAGSQPRPDLSGMVPKIDERLAEHASARREAYEAPPPAWPPIQRIKERSDEPQDMPRTDE
jgi:hypothetical protein